jgi:hypothetical protein
MNLYMKNPTAGGAAGLDKTSLPGRNDHRVAAARRELRLEFLHECAGGIRIHAELVQTFAEIGDTAGACYSLKRLFAHARAAHSVFVELRDEARRCP